jgi:hypothetical protein
MSSKCSSEFASEQSHDTAAGAGSYELRFTDLFNPGRGYAFPCDADGHVDIDSLGKLARVHYFYARTVVGREFHSPVKCRVARDEASRGSSSALA